MKVYKKILWAVCPMFLVACDNQLENEVVENVAKGEYIYSLSGTMQGGKVDSRAQIELGNSNSGSEIFMWNENDQFSMYQTIDGTLTQSVFKISADYSETTSENKKSAEFSTNTPVLADMDYVAVYPSDVPVVDNLYEFTLPMTLDFTSATSSDEKNEVWKEYFKQSMFMIANGQLSTTSPNAVNFNHITSLARVTYTNNSGSTQNVDGIRLGGSQNFAYVVKYNLSGYMSSSTASNSHEFYTNGLTVEDGETIDLYVFFFPMSFQEGDMHLSVIRTSGEHAPLTLDPAVISAANNNATGFEAGKRYWFKITETATGLYWNKSVPVSIDNVELSTALLAELGEDKVTLDENGYALIKKSDMAAITELNFSWKDYTITSLKGIEKFENLETLNCANTGLTECDLSQNTALKHVNVTYNNLTTLEFKNHSSLEYIACSSNTNLTTLDLSSCTNLVELGCNETALTSVTIPNPEKMQILEYGRTGLSFDLTSFTGLTILGCFDTNLSSLDFIPSNVKANLTYLQCQENNLTALDLSEFVNLENLNCSNNQIATLDITPLAKLNSLYCGNQKNDIKLILKLTDDQKTVWKSDWMNAGENTNVLLEGEVDESPSTGEDFGDGGEYSY